MEKHFGSITFPLPFEANFIPNILSEVYLRRIYDPFLIGRSNLVCVDWGANIGLVSGYLQDRSKLVVAVEPTQEAYHCLLQNIKNNHWDKVNPLKYAITEENKTLRIYRHGNKTAHNIYLPTESYEDVESITPDKFWEVAKLDLVDLLKIDIEGSEFEIICGGHLKKLANKIHCVVGELHDWRNRNYNQVAWAYRDMGFKFKFLKDIDASVYTAWRE